MSDSDSEEGDNGIDPHMLESGPSGDDTPFFQHSGGQDNSVVDETSASEEEILARPYEATAKGTSSAADIISALGVSPVGLNGSSPPQQDELGDG